MDASDIQAKISFQNPLRQNYQHVKVVAELLDFLPEDAIKPIVVFTGSAEFKTKKPQAVFTAGELIQRINSLPSGLRSQNRVAL